MLYIEVSGPGGPPHRVLWSTAEALIGRDPSNLVMLADTRVSRQHARLTRQGEGDVAVEDLGSANGVLIDEKPVGGVRALPLGTAFRIAAFVLKVVEAPAGEAGADGAPPGAGAGAARVVLVPLKPGVDHPLVAGRHRVGRGAGHGVVLADPSLSRDHAELTVHPDGTVWLQDLGSRNGTAIDGQEVSAAGARLPWGGQVTFGQVAFRLVEAASLGRATVAGAPGGASVPATAGARARGSRWWRAPLAAGLVTTLVAALVAALAAAGVAQGRPWRRITLGARLGPGDLEQRLAAQVEAGLRAAHAHMAAQAWHEAEGRFREVLALDPSQAQAHVGLLAAQDNHLDGEHIGQAQQALAGGDPAAALAEAARVPRGHALFKPAAKLAEDARQALAHRVQANGQQACRGGDWPACYQAAATLGVVLPEAAIGRALAAESLDALASRGRRMVDVGLVGEPRMARLYPDSEVRQAMWRYAAGDWTLAQRRLRTFAQHPGAGAAGRRFAQVREARRQGDQAEAEGDLERAIAAWDRASHIDAQLVPTGVSVVGQALRHRLATLMLARGVLAYDRGQLPAALVAWERGMAYQPSHPELPLQLARLEAHGQALLRTLAGVAAPDRLACERLREVEATTPEGSPPYREARSRLALCREPGPAPAPRPAAAQP